MKTESQSRRSLERLVILRLTSAQKRLKAKHGTPAEFAAACYEAVPGYISMDEAEAAVRKYNQEWAAAGITKKLTDPAT